MGPCVVCCSGAITSSLKKDNNNASQSLKLNRNLLHLSKVFQVAELLLMTPKLTSWSQQLKDGQELASSSQDTGPRCDDWSWSINYEELSQVIPPLGSSVIYFTSFISQRMMDDRLKMRKMNNKRVSSVHFDEWSVGKSITSQGPVSLYVLCMRIFNK